MEETGRSWVDSMPDAYERALVPTVFGPFALDLARRVAARSPRRVLELAAGTGVLTRQLVAALPAADVIATDLNAAMVELGAERAAGAAWEEADAMDLPFEDGRFDMVASQFGVMFFPDRRAAFVESRRVLRPGGTFLFNTWATLDTHDFQSALVAGVRRAFPLDPPTFMESIPHGYADLGIVAADLAASGFRRVAMDTVTLEGYASSAAEIAVGYCTGTPLRAEIEARGDLAAATAVVALEMERQLGTGRVSGKMTAHVIEAVPEG